MDIAYIAAVALTHLEDAVKQFLEESATGIGLSLEQARTALEMSFSNVSGQLPGTPYRREAVSTIERGVWCEPVSAFDHDSREPELNRIRDLRRACGMSLEALASSIEVGVAELALWEQGALPPRDVAEAMAGFFRVSLDFVVKSATGPEWDSFECNRCGEHAPGAGTWQLPSITGSGATGTELVCPDCLRPGDLDW